MSMAGTRQCIWNPNSGLHPLKAVLVKTRLAIESMVSAVTSIRLAIRASKYLEVKVFFVGGLFVSKTDAPTITEVPPANRHVLFRHMSKSGHLANNAELY